MIISINLQEYFLRSVVVIMRNNSAHSVAGQKSLTELFLITASGHFALSPESRSRRLQSRLHICNCNQCVTL